MMYETIPTPVEAHQQQLVRAEVPTFDPRPTDAPLVYAMPGDWIVKWPDGRLEVFTDSAFSNTFRKPVVSQPYQRPPFTLPNDLPAVPPLTWCEMNLPHPRNTPMCEVKAT